MLNTIFCRIVLKYDVFSHQILSIILTLIGWILISIPIFEKLSSEDIVPNIIFFFGAIFYPLYLVLFKFIIQNYYLSVFLNMLFIGIFLLIISITGLFTYSLIDVKNLSYIKEIFDISENNVLFYISLIPGTIVKVIFCLIIYYFTPNIFVLTNVISSIINWISNYFITKNKKETTLNLIFQGIGYFIILFSTLIYNEFIIFNFCGLNKNTIKNISERSNLEELELKMENTSLGKQKDNGLYFEAGDDDEFIVDAKRINKRVDIMIEKGLVDEVKRLIKKYDELPTAIQGLGYKEVVQYLNNEISYDEMEKLVRNLGFELHCDEMTLRIDGMHCASCTMNVENFLIRLDGIFDVKADLTTQSAKIRYDASKVSMDEIEKVIESLGFKLLGIG